MPWDDAAVIPAESYRNAQYETVSRRPPSIWSDPILCLYASGALHRQFLVLICSVYAADDLWRLEEVGWQGILQPLLQKRFPFLIAVLIEGAVWSIWHLPLWFIPASSQSTYSFAAFTLFCITLGATLAAAHRITKSIWVSVLLHAWSNTVLGGMYTLTSLCSFPNMRTLTISVIQILVVMGLAYLMKTKP